MTAPTQTGTAAPTAYTPPRVTIRPPHQPWVAPPRPGPGGTVVRVVLSVRTGDLYAIPSPPGDTTRGPYYDPGLDLWCRAWGYERTPTHIAWDTFPGPEWTSTSSAAAAHLARLAPTAQHLVDHLAPVPGTAGEWDWTPAATAAESRISAAAAATSVDDDFWRAPLPDRGSYGVVALSELLDMFPDFADPAWATMSDAELDAVAGQWCGTPQNPSGRYLPSHPTGQALRDRFHRRHDGGPIKLPIYLVRGRVDLRAWRAAAIQARTGLPTKPAGEHLAGGDPAPAGELAATFSDAELEQLAAAIDAGAAHRDGVALVGTVDYLRRHRAAQRARVRDELATVGAQHARAAGELRRLSAVRAGLLHQVVAFREPPEWPDGADEPNYAELGRLAGMTRQSAREAIGPALDIRTTAEEGTA